MSEIEKIESEEAILNLIKQIEEVVTTVSDEEFYFRYGLMSKAEFVKIKARAIIVAADGL